jgi:hypothetical protein
MRQHLLPRAPRLALLLALVASVAAVLVASPVSSAAPPSSSPLASVTTTINGVTYQLTNLAASAVNGALQITGTATNLATGQSGPISLLGTVTGAQPTGSCSILHLDIQPISLNLLGLQVTTSEIVLDITAQQGPGNLLGNLLCGVANLLNGGQSATGLANLLNNLFAALGI